MQILKHQPGKTRSLVPLRMLTWDSNWGGYNIFGKTECRCLGRSHSCSGTGWHAPCRHTHHFDHQSWHGTSQNLLPHFYWSHPPRLQFHYQTLVKLKKHCTANTVGRSVTCIPRGKIWPRICWRSGSLKASSPAQRIALWQLPAEGRYSWCNIR